MFGSVLVVGIAVTMVNIHNNNSCSDRFHLDIYSEVVFSKSRTAKGVMLRTLGPLDGVTLVMLNLSWEREVGCCFQRVPLR